MKWPKAKSTFLLSVLNRPVDNDRPDQPAKPQPTAEQPTTASRAAIAREYVDGYAYRKVASQAQVVAAIQGFCQDFLGREASPEWLSTYVQQWQQGRSLRSIRDEIANCLEAQRYGW